jgi:hypothetical protein
VEASQVAQNILASQKQPDAELLVDLARVYSQCFAAAEGKDEEARKYREQALKCLTKAKDQDYSDAVYLSSHPDFAALQTIQPFLDLVASITPK